MRPKIGLVLGGGGSRGLAHVGVLSILEEEKIPIDLIVATSMGAIIGAQFALGASVSEIKDHLKTIDTPSLFSLNIFSSKARQKVLEKQLVAAFGDKSFTDLKISTAIMAVDMQNGKEVALTTGKLVPAILASSAVPAIFDPVKHMGMQLADGGVLDSVATQPAYELGAEKVIVVDVNPTLRTTDIWEQPLAAITGYNIPFTNSRTSPGMLSQLWRAYRIMEAYIHDERLKAYPPTILLTPEVDEWGSLDFSNIDMAIESGRKEALKHIEELRELVGNSND